MLAVITGQLPSFEAGKAGPGSHEMAAVAEVSGFLPRMGLGSVPTCACHLHCSCGQIHLCEATQENSPGVAGGYGTYSSVAEYPGCWRPKSKFSAVGGSWQTCTQSNWSNLIYSEDMK